MSPIEHKTQQMMQALRLAVSDSLEQKRRLGQYAVVWRDNQAVRIGELESGSMKKESIKR
jgi:hypothetical protein